MRMPQNEMLLLMAAVALLAEAKVPASAGVVQALWRRGVLSLPVFNSRAVRGASWLSWA